MKSDGYPPWVILHVPHDSIVIPADVRSQFLLADAELQRELDRMTDHQTLASFSDQSSEAVVVRSPVSRHEMADPSKARPDICMGTDDFHTSDEMAGALSAALWRAEWRVMSERSGRGSGDTS